MYRDGVDLDVENDDDDEEGGQIRYFFPKGCKGIDVLIDNSSRLRALNIPVLDQIARLPVTPKTTTSSDSYVYSTPPSNYIPPGPFNIYRPDQIIVPPATISRPPQNYLPAKEPFNAYIPPPHKPSNVFLPPIETETKLPQVQKTSIAYIPQQITRKPPIAAYLPSANISNVYIPPKPSNDHQNTAGVGGNDCCCDDDEDSSSAKLIVPIPLKSIAGLP